MRNTLWLVALSMLLPLAGCKDKNAKRGEGAEIIIGEYGSMTGDTATFGTSCHEGLMLAIEEINKAGGVLGKQIKVVSEDDRSEPGEAVTAVQKLISRDKVVAVIGEVASTRSMAGAGPCQQNKIPMLSPASTNPQVTRMGDYVFRICFTDDFQGMVAAQFAQKKGWKRVAILTDAAQDYSKGLTKVFNETYPKGGGQVVASDNYKSKDNDFQTQLSKIKAANVDAVFMPGYYTDVGNVLRQARQIGLTVPFFGCDGWDSDKTLALGAIADGCYFTNHYSPDDPRPEVQKFIADYKARYGGRVPDAMAILGYDAGRVMADAIQRAGKADPTAIRDALAQTKDFPGASGKITIDAERNARKPIVILEIRGGKTRMEDAIAPE